MNAFEAQLAHATDAGEILAAIALVVDSKGNTVYHHAAGRQSLAPGAPPVDPGSTITLGSAGKFMTHIAALQCVDRGLIALDEPVAAHIPELGALDIISPSTDADAGKPFTLRRATKQITLRHLLTHSSGISDPSNALVSKWRESPEGKAATPAEDAHPIVKMFSMPLIYEPGDGFSYGSSVVWTQLLVARLSGKVLPRYMQDNIFDPLGMSRSTYQPQTRSDVLEHLLPMVERKGEHLTPADGEPIRDLTCSVPDLGRILSDLISPSSKILAPETAKLLFQPEFAPASPALKDLRGNTEDYAAPAGIPSSMAEPPVNYNIVGLFAEDTLPLSQIPPRTVTWNGMPNVIWAMNKEKGIAILFATQLLPVDDEQTVEVAMAFMREAWAKFA